MSEDLSIPSPSPSIKEPSHFCILRWVNALWPKTRIEFPGALVSRVCPQCRRPGVSPWVGKIPGRRKWQPAPVFLPEEFHGPGGLQSMGSQRVRHDWVTNTLTFTGHFGLPFRARMRPIFRHRPMSFIIRGKKKLQTTIFFTDHRGFCISSCEGQNKAVSILPRGVLLLEAFN